MAHPPEIVRAAHELYLTVTPDGRQKYSFGDIANEIQQQFSVEISRSMICRWAKKHGWSDQLAAAMALGVARTAAPARSLEPYREEELLAALALGKQSVITRQAAITEKANRYLDQLDDNDRDIPRAAEAATRTNQALFSMLAVLGFREESEFEIVVNLIGVAESCQDGSGSMKTEKATENTNREQGARHSGLNDL